VETKICSANNSPCEKNPWRQYSLDNIVHLILASKKRERELEETGRQIGCKRERGIGYKRERERGDTRLVEVFTAAKAMKAGRAEKARLYKGTFHTPVLLNISKACPSFAKAHNVRLYHQPVSQHWARSRDPSQKGGCSYTDV